MQRRTYASEEGWLLSYADLLTNLVIYFAVVMGAAQVSGALQDSGSDAVHATASLAAIQAEVAQRIVEEGLSDQVTAEVAPDGLRLSLNAGIVFDPGSAEVQPTHEPVVARMLEVLAPYAADYAFAVEGHTDSIPLDSADGRSNWDLSSARAIAVRDRLEGVGVDAQRIRVEGYADTVPLPEHLLAGKSAPERAALHRRVVVRVY